MPVCRYRGGGDCWCVSAVGEVVARLGPAPPCPAGDAGLVAGGEGKPGADLADAGGHEQEGGGDGLGGDAAGAAAVVAGGRGTPGAELADAGGHEQQGGEDGLGGDAADAASCGLGEGF